MTDSILTWLAVFALLFWVGIGIAALIGHRKNRRA